MDEREGRNRVGGSVGDLSQAHTHTQPVRHSMALSQRLTRLRNRLGGEINFPIVRVVPGERTTKYMRAYAGGNT